MNDSQREPDDPSPIGPAETWRSLEQKSRDVEAQLRHLRDHAQRRYGELPAEARAIEARAEELLREAASALEPAEAGPGEAAAEGHEKLARELDAVQNAIHDVARKLGAL